MYRALLVRVEGREEPVAALAGAIRVLVKREYGRVRIEYYEAHAGLELPDWVERQLKIRRVPCVDGSIGEREIRVVGVVDEG